jgi:prepilin-type N-terminal cleavage/methylation domain-containing protein
MHPSSRPHNQAGFSIIEMLVATTVMLIISATVISLLRSSLSVANSTYEMTDAQENLRTAHEFISRDLISAGDGLKSMSNIPVAAGFVTNYLDSDPIPAVNGATNLGILTSNNNVPAGQTVFGPSPLVATVPVVSVRSNPVLTDRQTILQVDSSFTSISLAPNKINAAGTQITILDGDLPRFTPGEIYFLTSTLGGTFGVLTGAADVDGPGVGTPNSILTFATGATADPLGINVAGPTPANGFQTISTSGTLTTSLQRMKIIHYYIDTTGRLMRRVFGVKGEAGKPNGFRESAIAEHVVSVQFLYSLGPDITGVAPAPVTALDATQQSSVRQVDVTITVETTHTLEKGKQPQISSSQTTSVRNMQFRTALQPKAIP